MARAGWFGVLSTYCEWKITVYKDLVLNVLSGGNSFVNINQHAGPFSEHFTYFSPTERSLFAPLVILKSWRPLLDVFDHSCP